MKPKLLLHFLLHSLVALLSATADHGGAGTSSIIFTTLGRLDYFFDIFTLPITDHPRAVPDEIQLTDGESVNFNGHFPSPSSTFSLLSLLPNKTLIQTRFQADPPPLQLVYVTERDGVSNLFYDVVFSDKPSSDNARRRSVLEVSDRVQVPLLGTELVRDKVSMKDRPNLAGEYVVYVSTHENTGEPRTSWAAVYSTGLKSGVTRKLTPYGVADFSPAVSPSGTWTAVASYGVKGWDGEVEELSTDIYVFLTRDGTRRVKVVEHGGWPSWVDESTLYFHRRGEDHWWSIYRAILPSNGHISVESVVVERVTPPGLHAFTPATSPGNKNFIAVATRRPTSSFRHIELFDLGKNEFKELTRLVSPQTHHLNPFISPDSTRVGYHKCRGDGNGRKGNKLFLENVHSPVSDLSLFRIDGSFPSVSPGNDLIAYVKLPGVFVVNLDGSNRRKVYDGSAFSTAWDPVRKGVFYSGAGPEFAPVSSEVDIVSFNVEDPDQVTIKKLTTNGKNNAFPSPSPDGKRIVFRSGQTGYKNLYIMDAEDGEKSGLHRLTEGPWTDTMCSWSPDGKWIAFVSDRHNPGGGSFELYLIHPNGTGLRKLLQSGSGGRTNHPVFSPDGKSITFTTDNAGISAEPISNPHHYQPYGEIYTIKLDGSDLTRLTHNSYEDGTPFWVPKYIRPVNVEWPIDRPRCRFEDLHWLNEVPGFGFGLVDKAQCGRKG
ncbi:Tol-Pal system beta propeller repeat-containing protein [Trema orientale]|uniref:Tol-Pal system beta propeller repeat-containing protein n=1 Tax=Trema orientale TaxID=63057 RepID=A0A2P5F173_TREOI|nr:Tol-Pal system beta propeller repeat-containing protein [Trema orientale]